LGVTGKHLGLTSEEKHLRRIDMLRLYRIGMPLKDIAEKYNCSVSNAHSVIHRHIAKLRKRNANLRHM
jgi:uncharacterized protein YjcR